MKILKYSVLTSFGLTASALFLFLQCSSPDLGQKINRTKCTPSSANAGAKKSVKLALQDFDFSDSESNVCANLRNYTCYHRIFSASAKNETTHNENCFVISDSLQCLNVETSHFNTVGQSDPSTQTNATSEFEVFGKNFEESNCFFNAQASLPNNSDSLGRWNVESSSVGDALSAAMVRCQELTK